MKNIIEKATLWLSDTFDSETTTRNTTTHYR